MKSKFNSLFNRGGQILFALTLTMMMMSTFSFGQVGDFTIYGESLWRNQGYGVENHYFQIENYVIPEMDSWYVPSDPVTDECPYEVYTTDYMPLYTDDYNDLANTIKIWPYSVNNAADYRNGVSSLDLYAISAHLLSSPAFESRTPTEDAPYRYISGDADGDFDVDDIDMIQDLILFLRDDLDRNSWEWVHKDEVEEAEERFEETPYQFVISENWSYPEGIILPALSTNQIMADNDKYFTFRSTKIGDITATTNLAITSANTWVCGNNNYFAGNQLETRSSRDLSPLSVRIGSIITLGILLDNDEDIYALELPLFFSDEDFKMIDIDFHEGYTPLWHRNSEKGSLVILDFSKSLEALQIPRGKLVEIKIEARHNISDISKSIRWHPNRIIELVGEKETSLEPEVTLEVLDVLPSELYVEVRTGMAIPQLMVESPKDQQIQVFVFNANGQAVYTELHLVAKGQNNFPLREDLIAGIYLINVQSEHQHFVTKWTKS